MQNLKLIKFIKDFVGDEGWDSMKETSKEELTLFKKQKIDLKSSYLVYGSPSLLEKFKIFYLTRCIKDRPYFKQYYMDEYASVLSSGTKDTTDFLIDVDLLFLYKNNHSYSFGNSDAWLVETILNKVSNRNRDGLVTIILSEIALPDLEHSGEFITLNLAGITASLEKSKAISTIASQGSMVHIDQNNTVYGS